MSDKQETTLFRSQRKVFGCNEVIIASDLTEEGLGLVAGVVHILAIAPVVPPLDAEVLVFQSKGAGGVSVLIEEEAVGPAEVVGTSGGAGTVFVTGVLQTNNDVFVHIG